MPLKIKTMSNIKYQQMSVSYILSVVLIIIGGVCSIVGLCVSIEWIIGVGIAIICISSVLAYNSIPKGRPQYQHAKSSRKTVRARI